MSSVYGQEKSNDHWIIQFANIASDNMTAFMRVDTKQDLIDCDYNWRLYKKDSNYVLTDTINCPGAVIYTDYLFNEVPRLTSIIRRQYSYGKRLASDTLKPRLVEHIFDVSAPQRQSWFRTMELEGPHDDSMKVIFPDSIVLRENTAEPSQYDTYDYWQNNHPDFKKLGVVIR